MKLFGALVIALGLLYAGCSVFEHKQSGDAGNRTQTSAEYYYTCPMHPSVRSDRPGACPICGMALVKKTLQARDYRDDSTMLGMVSLSPRQRLLANVSTVPVERRTFEKEINTVGILDFAEPNLRHITMRFAGRLEQLYLRYTGQTVRAGDPVASVYSPDAISAQQEYVLAAKSYEAAKEMDSTVLPSGVTMLEQSREKLLRWGFSPHQIEELRHTKEIKTLVTIFSPISGTVVRKNVDPQQYAAAGEVIYDLADLSTLWMYADVYEQDLRFINVGQTIKIRCDAYPNEAFLGAVTFIDPVMNGDTRTVRVRTEVRNPEQKLKPQMYVSAKVVIDIPRALVVPSSAVLSTGKRTIVWVETSPNMFEPRDVEVGSVTDSHTEIVSGLREGEEVAASGGFLIDSESALQNPSGAGTHSGHATTRKEK